jgi:hypothetical protein
MGILPMAGEFSVKFSESDGTKLALAVKAWEPLEYDFC